MEKGGELVLSNPFASDDFKADKEYSIENGKILISMEPGDTTKIQNK